MIGDAEVGIAGRGGTSELQSPVCGSHRVRQSAWLGGEPVQVARRRSGVSLYWSGIRRHDGFPSAAHTHKTRRLAGDLLRTIQRWHRLVPAACHRVQFGARLPGVAVDRPPPERCNLGTEAHDFFRGSEAAGTQRPPRGPARVLSVLDQRTTVELVKLTLNHGMYVVRNVASLPEVETALPEWQPHLMLIDMDLDGARILQLVVARAGPRYRSLG